MRVGITLFLTMFLVSFASADDYIKDGKLTHTLKITQLQGGFAGFTVVSVLTGGGPLGSTTVLATAAFMLGIAAGNLPMGSAVALCMVPILAVCATVILRRIVRRGSGSDA